MNTTLKNTKHFQKASIQNSSIRLDANAVYPFRKAANPTNTLYICSQQNQTYAKIHFYIPYTLLQHDGCMVATEARNTCHMDYNAGRTGFSLPESQFISRHTKTEARTMSATGPPAASALQYRAPTDKASRRCYLPFCL